MSSASLLHTVRLCYKHWICPLEHRSLPALGKHHSRGSHGVDDRPASLHFDLPRGPNLITLVWRIHNSPLNMAATASVEPVRITLLLERTTQDCVFSRPNSRPSRATLVLTKRMLIAPFPGCVGSRGRVQCCFPSAGGAPGECACSPSDGGLPDDVLVSLQAEALLETVLVAPRRRSRWKPCLLRPEICGRPW